MNPSSIRKRSYHYLVFIGEHRVCNRNNQQVSVYRGGNDFTVSQSDIRIDYDTGLVKTTHGVSLNIDPNAVPGQAYKIESIPDGLQIIQRGNNPMHFEIVPSTPMSLSQFQNLLNQIVTSLIG